MNLMMFELLFHPDAFSEIEALSPSMRAKALNALDKLEMLGNALRFPHTRAMGEGLFELRTGNKYFSRNFFDFAFGIKFFFLLIFLNKTQKTPASEIELALKRLGEMTDESTTH